jgi:hypothetical protein
MYFYAYTWGFVVHDIGDNDLDPYKVSHVIVNDLANPTSQESLNSELRRWSYEWFIKATVISVAETVAVRWRGNSPWAVCNGPRTQAQYVT